MFLIHTGFRNLVWYLFFSGKKNENTNTLLLTLILSFSFKPLSHYRTFIFHNLVFDTYPVFSGIQFSIIKGRTITLLYFTYSFVALQELSLEFYFEFYFKLFTGDAICIFGYGIHLLQFVPVPFLYPNCFQSRMILLDSIICCMHFKGRENKWQMDFCHVVHLVSMMHAFQSMPLLG